MKFIVTLILFWLSIFGYVLLLNKKTKIKLELCLPLIFSLIGILIFILGILNIMKLSSIVIFFFGLVMFVKLFKFNMIKKVNVNFIIYLIIIVLITILCYNFRFIEYDNFSHWGTIVKTILNNNALPNFETPIIDFKGYQPGSACFIYYFCSFVGQTEGCMIMGQNYLILSYVFALFVFTKENNLNENLKRLLILLFYIFVITFNVLFDSLLVDTLIGTTLITSFVIFYEYKKDLKKSFLYSLPISTFIILIKNVGFVLLLFNCIALLYISIKNKQIIKGIKYILCTLLICFSLYFIWSRHVVYVFGQSGLYSKHSLTLQNILVSLKAKGVSGIMYFLKIYIKNFLNIFNNTPNLYIIFANLILFISSFFIKKNKKSIYKTMFCITTIYLVYYFILGIMYLVSMPWDEAIRLACFNRYMYTVIIPVVAIVMVVLFSIFDTNQKYGIIIKIILILLFLFIIFNYNNFDKKLLLGKQNYINTDPYKIDIILNDKGCKFEQNDWYYIYVGGTHNSKSYINYLARYKLNTINITIINSMEELQQVQLNDEYNNKILLLYKDEKVLQHLKENKYKKYCDKIYSLN